MPNQEVFKNKSTNEALILIEKKLNSKKQSWEDLIESTGIERQVVSGWLNGHKKPSINNWNAISLFTKIPIKEILEKTPFDLSIDNDLFEQDINFHFEKSGLSQSEVYQEKGNEISRGLLWKTLNGQQPIHKTLIKFQKLFKLDSIFELLKTKD